MTLSFQSARTGPVPLSPRRPCQLEATIDDGRLAPGDQIENEIALADRLGLSRPTVRRAIQDLGAKGMLVRQRGVGTQVASRMVHRRVVLTSLHDDLARAGRSPRTEVLSFE